MCCCLSLTAGHHGNRLLGGITKKTKFIRPCVRGNGVSMATARYTHAVQPWIAHGPGHLFKPQYHLIYVVIATVCDRLSRVNISHMLSR